VVHLAALADVVACELNKELAMRVNFLASKLLAEEAAKAGSFLLYVPTDYVFDGGKGLYREEDKPPLSQHVRSFKAKRRRSCKGVLFEVVYRKHEYTIRLASQKEDLSPSRRRKVG
jgi:nucleoside-diphosphate-sugar epimerase